LGKLTGEKECGCELNLSVELIEAKENEEKCNQLIKPKFRDFHFQYVGFA
jgi:hypothetical protein